MKNNNVVDDESLDDLLPPRAGAPPRSANGKFAPRAASERAGSMAAFARSVVEDPTFRENLKQRLVAGKASPAEVRGVFGRAALSEREPTSETEAAMELMTRDEVRQMYALSVAMRSLCELAARRGAAAA